MPGGKFRFEDMGIGKLLKQGRLDPMFALTGPVRVSRFPSSSMK
jgi:hypothetical protein